jgi:hypothetical protein
MPVHAPLFGKFSSITFGGEIGGVGDEDAGITPLLLFVSWKLGHCAKTLAENDRASRAASRTASAFLLIYFIFFLPF